MPLGEVTIRSDWRNIEKLEQADRAAKRNLLQLALIGYGLAALAIAGLPVTLPVLQLLQILFFVAAFLWLPLYTAVGSRPRSRRTLAVAAAVFLIAVILAFATAPPTIRPPWVRAGILPPWLSVLIPPSMALLLLWSGRRHPGSSYELGLTKRAWAYQAAIGLSLGTALGLHAWITVGSLPYGRDPTLAPLPTMVWLVMTEAGLAGLGEELALRGALFRLLSSEARGLRAGTVLRIIALGAPLYIAPIAGSPHGAPLLLGLLYGIVFGVLALVLRVTSRGIVAPLAANVAFRVLILLVNNV